MLGNNCGIQFALAVMRGLMNRKEEHSNSAHLFLLKQGEDSTMNVDQSSLLAAFLNTITDGMIISDRSGNILAHNGHLVEVCRIPTSLLSSGNVAGILRYLKSDLSIRSLPLTAITRCVEVLEFKDGRAIEVCCSSLQLSESTKGIIWRFKDIGERHRQQENKRTQAHPTFRSVLYDDLTSLPNQSFFLNALGSSMEQARSSSEGLPAVLFLDLDRFTLIKEAHGHALGDSLLKDV